MGVAYVVALFLVAVLILLARDQISGIVRRFRNPPGKVAAAAAAYEAKLLRPDWAYFEEFLKRPIPVTLRVACSNPDVVLKSHDFGPYHIDFVPIDRSESGWDWVRPGVVPFAQSDGDPIYLEPGEDQPNRVHIAYHDGGGSDVLAESIDEFLAKLRFA